MVLPSGDGRAARSSSGSSVMRVGSLDPTAARQRSPPREKTMPDPSPNQTGDEPSTHGAGAGSPSTATRKMPEKSAVPAVTATHAPSGESAA